MLYYAASSQASSCPPLSPFLPVRLGNLPDICSTLLPRPSRIISLVLLAGPLPCPPTSSACGRQEPPAGSWPPLLGRSSCYRTMIFALLRASVSVSPPPPSPIRTAPVAMSSCQTISWSASIFGAVLSPRATPSSFSFLFRSFAGLACSRYLRLAPRMASALIFASPWMGSPSSLTSQSLIPLCPLPWPRIVHLAHLGQPSNGNMRKRTSMRRWLRWRVLPLSPW